MENIKSILDEISAEPGTNAKMSILNKYSDNELLKTTLYLAMSKRVKFYIKQIPDFQYIGDDNGLEWAIEQLHRLSSREFTGTAAVNHLQYILGGVNPSDQYVVKRIIEKDLKIGIGRTNVNKVIESLVEKTPYMGAKSYDKKLVEAVIKKGKALSQIKMDGRYANAIIRDGDVELESRAGEPNGLKDALFLKELSQLGDEIVLNGELTVIGVPVRRTANGIVSSLVDIQLKEEERGPVETQKKIDEFLKKHRADFGKDDLTFQEALDSVVYTCWDMIKVEEYYEKKSKRPYETRFEELNALISEKNPTRIEIVETREVTTVKEAMQHFTEAIERELEGTILKDSKGEWKDGKPNWQVKMKLDMNVDLRIIGFEMGTPGTKNENWVSTLNLESSCGLLKTNPSNMDENMMQYVTDNQDKLMGAIVEVNCKGLSQNKFGDWSLMHPSVVEIREDKDTCDSLESAKAIEESVKSL
jgi:hypothetical protein